MCFSLIIAYVLAWLLTIVYAPSDLNTLHYLRFEELKRSRASNLTCHFFANRSFHDDPNPYRVDLEQLSHYTVSYPKIPTPFFLIVEHKVAEAYEVAEHTRVRYLWTPWRLYELSRKELEHTVPVPN